MTTLVIFYKSHTLFSVNLILDCDSGILTNYSRAFKLYRDISNTLEQRHTKMTSENSTSKV